MPSSEGDAMDKIIVNGLKLYAYHGVNPEEKEDGQLFILDITAFLSLYVPCQTDMVENTVSYAKIIKTGADGCLRKGWTYEYSDTSYRGKKG